MEIGQRHPVTPAGDGHVSRSHVCQQIRAARFAETASSSEHPPRRRLHIPGQTSLDELSGSGFSALFLIIPQCPGARAVVLEAAGTRAALPHTEVEQGDERRWPTSPST